MSCKQPAQRTPKQCRDSRTNSAPGSRRRGARRQQDSRGARQCPKFDSNELHELVLTSELVPSGCISGSSLQPKPRALSDTPSTSAPSSAEQSPERVSILSDAETWPSLQQAQAAGCGWELCSELSDIDNYLDAMLPPPAFNLDVPVMSFLSSDKPLGGKDIDSWCVVGVEIGNEPSELLTSSVAKIGQIGSMPTLADLLRDGQSCQLPPPCGTLMPPVGTQPFRRCSGGASSNVDQKFSDGHFETQQVQSHGRSWDQKASWKAKQQRKIAEHKAQRIHQSCQNFGWMEDPLGDEA